MSIAVVLSTYNRAETLLRRALPSVFRQTVPCDQIIVVGDGTDVETCDAMVELMRLDSRIEFTNRHRQRYPDDPMRRWSVLGLEARNFGLDQVRTDYVTTLDDDDEFTDDHNEVLLQTLTDSGADFAYGRSTAFWADGSRSEYGNWPPGHFQFCDGAWLAKPFSQRYEMECLDRGLPEDGDLWDRLVLSGTRFAFTERFVHRYYPNPR